MKKRIEGAGKLLVVAAAPLGFVGGGLVDLFEVVTGKQKAVTFLEALPKFFREIGAEGWHQLRTGQPIHGAHSDLTRN